MATGSEPVHPAACIFPMMDATSYAGLLEDIRANGQNEPIVYWKQQLLDGRNRLKACRELGIEPETCELEESTDPVAWVVAANLHRRQLQTSQRAMIAARMATLKNGQHGEAVSNETAIQDAATLLNVGRATVCRAKHVIEHGCKQLATAVENRDVTLHLAYRLCRQCEDKKEQAKLVKQGKAAIKEHLDEAAEPKAAASPSKPAESSELVQVFRKTANRIAAIKQLIAELEPHEACVVIDSIGDWCEAYANAE